mmetsp:Transcript_51370/g.101789  ORF Transcript_51370/g.101789 Transcript_51370/m.101789 type:complete len:258 (-) Transcript_51370:756-1529(-)
MAVHVHKRPASQLLLLQRLPKVVGRGRDGALDAVGDGSAEVLAVVVDRELEGVRGEREQLRPALGLRVLGAPQSALEHGHDVGHVGAVALLHPLLQEAPQPPHAQVVLHPRGLSPPHFRLHRGQVVHLAPPQLPDEGLVGAERVAVRPPHPPRRHRREEGPAREVRVQLFQNGGQDEVLDVGAFGELGQLGVELGVDQHRAAQVGVDLLHQRARRGVLPIGRVLNAQDDVLGAHHLVEHQVFRLLAHLGVGPLVHVD